MSRLEEKLIDLGYRFYRDYNYILAHNDDITAQEKKIKIYFKGIRYTAIVIEIDTLSNKIESYQVSPTFIDNHPLITSQEDVDDIQKAFNEMQKDLEELKND